MKADIVSTTAQGNAHSGREELHTSKKLSSHIRLIWFIIQTQGAKCLTLSFSVPLSTGGSHFSLDFPNMQGCKKGRMVPELSLKLSNLDGNYASSSIFVVRKHQVVKGFFSKKLYQLDSAPGSSTHFK